jgi:hypothetical protein
MPATAVSHRAAFKAFDATPTGGAGHLVQPTSLKIESCW